MSHLFASAGSKLYIGPVKAYTDTDFTAGDFPSSGEGAIDWTQISGTTNLGSAGDTAELITSAHHGNARMRKLKGVRDAGSMEVVCDLDYADAGQIALIAAEKTSHTYAFRLVFNDAPPGGTPSERFFVALVLSAAEQYDEPNSVMKLNATLSIDSNIVRVAAAPDD